MDADGGDYNHRRCVIAGAKARWQHRWTTNKTQGATMRASSDHILTSHAGSLPRPDALIEANRNRAAADEARFQAQLRAAVGDVVARQKAVGIDLPGDGEYGKAMGSRVNYGAWWSYSFQRLGGLELSGPGLYDVPARRSS